MTLLELLARNALERPEAPALLSLDAGSLSHGDLHALAMRTIATLHEAGFGADDTLVLSLRYGPDAVAATTTIATACGAAVRDAELGTDELTTTFDRLRPAAVVVDDLGGGAASMAAARGLPVLEVRGRPDEPAGTFDLKIGAAAGTSREPRRSRADDVAIVLETSSTSGRPKQVPLTHTNLLAGARAMTNVLGIGPDDRCVHLLPLFNIAGLTAPLLVPLWSGGSTVIAGPFDTERFLRAAAGGATWWNAGPTVQRALWRAVMADPERWRETSTTLRLTRCSGASLAADEQALLEDAYGFPVVHAYGMTETVSQVTCNSPSPAGSRRGTAGRPIENEVRVMADDGDAAGPGVFGEVQVRGPSVLTGYVGDPQTTAEAFVDGWFRTGDLGRFDDDGFLTVLGRRDEIINRGGALVSPAEVDAVAIAHPKVTAAATFALPHPTLGQEVGLAIVTEGGEPPDLQSFLAARLAPRKRPRFVQVVETIPRTATGKPRRAALAEEVAHLRRMRPSDPPSGPVEQRLADLWLDVTGREPEGRDDHFFLSGGDSLQAVTLLAAIEDQLGFALELGPFLTTPTLAGLAAAIDHFQENSVHHHGGIHLLWPGSGAAPVVMFSGVGGLGITVAPLAGRVAREHPVIVMDAPGLHSGRHPRRMEQVAAYHFRGLEPIIGTEPCVLVGYSLGSVVALELARQREAAGLPTALVLVDRPPAERTRVRLSGRALLLARGIARGVLRRGSADSRRRARVRDMRTRARSRYHDAAFDGPIWVLATKVRQQRWGDDLGWTASLGRPVTVIPIPGEHLSLRYEPVAVAAVADVVAEAAALLSQGASHHPTDDDGLLPGGH